MYPAAGGRFLNDIDVTGQRRTEVALARERDFIRVVLDTAGAMIVVLDRLGRPEEAREKYRRAREAAPR